MPPEFSILDLARLVGVTPRTVRYYIEQGLLPAPTQSGPKARYTEEHLERLRLIRKLQGGHLPLAEIRARLRTTTSIELGTLSDPAPETPPGSAADYIREVLHGRPSPRATPLPPPPVPASASTAAIPTERAQWERISLDPDIELHIRRPLTRHNTKRVERLIAIARQLLEED